MPNKMGRPKSSNPKNIDVKIRFDEKSHENLMNYCKKNGITRTEAIRKGIDLLLEEKK